MTHLQRPCRVGLGDAAADGGGGIFDFSAANLNLPTTASGAIDWSQLTVPPIPVDFSLPAGTPSPFMATTPAAPPTPPLNFNTIANDIVKGAQSFFNAQTAINQANYGSQLAKAQAQAAINIAKAGGQAAVRTAGAGTPSPTLLLFGGLGLAAILLLKK